jgi:muramidase (phage lysozyme)
MKNKLDANTLWSLVALMVALIATIATTREEPTIAPPIEVRSTIAASTPTKTPERAAWIVVIAFLRTTAFAEGVWPQPGAVDSYRTQALSWRQIPLDYAYKKHPYWTDGIIPCATVKGERVCSACTGAYQFHPDTYEKVRKEYRERPWFNDGDFSPRNQDLAAMYLMEERGIWAALSQGIKVSKNRVSVDRKAFSNALSKGASEWASFPRHEGDRDGALGQHAADSGRLWEFFSKQLKELQSQESHDGRGL